MSELKSASCLYKMMLAFQIGILGSLAILQEKDLKQSSAQVWRAGCRIVLLKVSDRIQR